MGEASNGAAAAVDSYGFPLHYLDGAQRRQLAAAQHAVEARAAAWASEKGRFRRLRDQLQRSALKKACRRGIPVAVRPAAWPELSGANALRAALGAEHYARCRAAASQEGSAAAPYLKQIDLDVPRTFPEHAFFQSDEGQAALRAVLTAYVAHDPDTGYCQSLNFVAGFLLLALGRDAEAAFWVLAALVGGARSPAA